MGCGVVGGGPPDVVVGCGVDDDVGIGVGADVAGGGAVGG